MTNKCPICGREEGGQMQIHHLLPRTFRSRTSDVHLKDNKIIIHKMCHQKIHATFSEHELFVMYRDVDTIINHPEMQKFVKWIGKKPIDFYSKNNDTADRKRKR